MRSGIHQPDLNPILDEGAQKSHGGMENALELSDALGIEFVVDEPRELYFHAWGDKGESPRRIIATWYMMAVDDCEQPTVISFDLVAGRSPLIIGLDLKQYADTINQGDRIISFKRPVDAQARRFSTYIEKDGTGNERLRMEILYRRKRLVCNMLSSQSRRKDINFAKRIHRFSHASADQMETILRDAGKLTTGISEACKKVHDSCDICASSGRPRNHKKVSLSHVNKAFNESIQADFLTIYISGEKYEVINIIDAGTNYGEREIVKKKDANEMKSMLESEWLYHHGSPRTFSADPEFCRPVLEKFLKSHNIDLEARPCRSSSKNGKVERNNGLFKTVLSRIERESTNSSPRTLVARASLLKKHVSW